MQPSDIVVPNLKETDSFTEQQQKLRQAYLYERHHLALMDVELNRSKIVIIDEHGRFVHLAFVLEH